MKEKISLIVMAIILILPVTFYAIFKAPENSGKLEAATGKPIVLEFSSAMCSECQKLQKVLEEVEPKYDKKISFQKINANLIDAAAQEKIKKYNVKSVPTTIFIDKKGKIVAQEIGSMTEEALVLHLEELLNK